MAAVQIDKTTVPFDRVSDVTVNMTIVRPAPIIGLGNLLILNKLGAEAKVEDKSDTLDNTDKINGLLLRKIDKENGAEYREFSDLDAVQTAFESTTKVYAKAKTYFAQDAPSDRVVVLDYTDGKLAEALKQFWYFNWTFAIFADNTIGDDSIIASNIFEANEDHFLVLQTNDTSQFTQFYGQNYTIGLKHDVNEAMDAALIGSTASKQVGSVTWKFRSMNGITPEEITTNERKGLDRTHAIAYIKVSGSAETSEGWTMSGEYIDSLHGDLWIKTNIQDKLQRLLMTHDKIPYEATGINLLASQVIEVLSTAWEQGIILTTESGKGDYSVTASPRSEQSQKDLSDRHYGGLSFVYHRSGAIHSVTVNGTVQSDRILN